MLKYDEFLSLTGLNRVPPYWDRRYVKNLDKLSKPCYQVLFEEDVTIQLRDGTCLKADIYRPDVKDEKFPALVAWSAYGKTMQALKRGTIPPKSLIFDHSLEAGDIDFFVSRGYVYIIPDPRGIGKSEGDFLGVYNPEEQKDCYDTIEWAAAQQWCTGRVSMVGYSYFGIIQMLTAAQQPPHLKCIMPLSFTDDYYQHGHYGGVANTYLSIYWELCPSHSPISWSEKIYTEEELKGKMQERLSDPDISKNSYFTKILTTWPPRYHTFFLDVLLHPYDGPFWEARSAKVVLEHVSVPVYMKTDWSSPSGRWTTPAFRTFMDERLAVHKKVASIEGYGALELPYRAMNEEQLRWYDYWLKGVDTGLMDEPPIKMELIDGGFRFEHEWPLKRTQWRKLYLRSFGRLTWRPDTEADLPPDILPYIPPTISSQVPSLIYTSDPFRSPTEFCGPVTLYIYASFDAEDANIIVNLYNILPDGKKHSVRRFGALKASHRLKSDESKPWAPVHDHTQSVPLECGRVYEFVIEINPIGWIFHQGHRMQLEITGMDPNPYQQHSWVGKVGNLGPIPSSKAMTCRIYRDALYESHVLLPYISETPEENWIQPIAESL